MSTPAVAGARTNVLAIVSLVTSIIGLSLVGVITGHIGLNQIKKTGEEGRGLAIAGLIIGYIGLAFVLLWFFAFGGLLAIAAISGGTSVS
jgi:peptidyl-prolyl cis-trans isomerase B (cyclophilin B)